MRSATPAATAVAWTDAWVTAQSTAAMYGRIVGWVRREIPAATARTTAPEPNEATPASNQAWPSASRATAAGTARPG